MYNLAQDTHFSFPIADYMRREAKSCSNNTTVLNTWKHNKTSTFNHPLSDFDNHSGKIKSKTCTSKRDESVVTVVGTTGHQLILYCDVALKANPIFFSANTFTTVK